MKLEKTSVLRLIAILYCSICVVTVLKYVATDKRTKNIRKYQWEGDMDAASGFASGFSFASDILLSNIPMYKGIMEVKKEDISRNMILILNSFHYLWA